MFSKTICWYIVCFWMSLKKIENNIKNFILHYIILFAIMNELPIIEDIDRLEDSRFWLGFRIFVSDESKNVTCKIENAQKCCEVYGAFTPTPLEDFIGAVYYDVTFQDNMEGFNETNISCIDETVQKVITVRTSRGNIVFCLYNCHNGYYSHDTYVKTQYGIVKERI